MDETKSNEAVYSSERTKTTGPHSLRSTPGAAESPGAQNTAPAAKPTQPPTTTDTHEDPRTGGYSPVVIGNAGGQSPLADFAEFLKRTKQVWLIAAAAIFGLWLVVTLAKGLFQSAKASREVRQQRAVGTLTAEGLLQRCGQPAEDVTKEMYPIVLRTISYQSGENEKYVFEFSRTAEEKSDWVFLSMKDQSGAKNYDTPEAKIAAMPCLDSKK
jgi:hypothetical protein